MSTLIERARTVRVLTAENLTRGEIVRLVRVVVALDAAIGSLYHRDDEPMTADLIRRHRETLDRLRALLDEVTA